MQHSGGRWSHVEGATGHLVTRAVMAPLPFQLSIPGLEWEADCDETYRVAQVSGIAKSTAVVIANNHTLSCFVL